MTNLPFFVLFTVDIVRAARATEDPHNICLSEPLAPIMKFSTGEQRVAAGITFEMTCHLLQLCKL